MRFDSVEFLLFFLVVYAVFLRLRTPRVWLLAASYLFYASWNPPFLLLLLLSTGLDYRIGLALSEARPQPVRRLLLAASLTINLGVLAWFKYVDFVLDNLVVVGLVRRAVVEPWMVEASIPLGLSFYTFQTLSYSIDMYRRRGRPCTSWFDFALFVAFFPQLVAGPIVRAEELIPQIRARARPSLSEVREGVELVLVGLFKKVAIADNFALLVDDCYARPEAYSGLSLTVATFAFSAQIYCDFSGYSTIARGLAISLGFRLPRNFDYPLLAADPIAYRRGWHMSMARWFRDYLYHPLGGDRRGLPRALLNTFLVWTAFGLWHGASWNFVGWGALNGAIVVGWRWLRHVGALPPPSRWTTVFGHLTMPLFIVHTNLFFRASSLADAGVLLRRMWTWAPGEAIDPRWAVALVVLLLAHIASRRWYVEGWTARAPAVARYAFVVAMVVGIRVLASSDRAFYYFQF